MPDIRCSHCGKENPDFLDVCQFCQSPLKSESMLHIGEKPTKKNTGELEGVLPDWLKSARQQARASAEEEAAQAAAQPKVQKEEPPDLLAGLAFQSESSDEEDVPDWLSSINPVAKSKPATPVTPKPETDFFAQFNKSEPTPVDRSTPVNPPVQPQSPSDRDELSEWFVQASEQPAEGLNESVSPSHSDWGIGESASFQTEQTPAPKEEEDLSWLHNLESAAKHTDELKSPKTPDWGSEPGAPAQSSGDDDLSWLNNLGAIPTPEQPSQPQEDLSWLNTLGGTSTPAATESSDEDLSWLNKLGAATAEPGSPPAKPQEDLSWLKDFSNEPPAASQPASSASFSQDDMSWLNQLGASSGEPAPSQASKPEEDLGWLNALGNETPPAEPAATPSASQDDLSWLNRFSATPAEPAEPAPQSEEDLSWLGAFGSQTPQSSQLAPTQASSEEDLSWLNKLGATPVEEPARQEKPEEDLSWLNAFGSTPEASQPAPTPSATDDDLNWLNSLQGQQDTLSAAPFSESTADETSEADVPHVSPFLPRKTAPLDQGAAEPSMPDWLKSATEGPSMPMGAGALDQFREDYKIPTAPEEPFSWKSFTQEAKPAEERPAPSTPEPVSFDPGFFGPAGESSTASTEDVNSLFSVEMPDWLSQAEPTRQEELSQSIGIHAEGGEALSPVDLPSWVQAMRPVDAAISEAGPSIDDQPTEREGPLAGFKGLIPAGTLGSARRPKPLSLKLQASEEQQSSAAILEQLLVAETSPRPLVTTPVFASQRALRWGLAGMFIFVLGLVLALRSQMFTVMPIATGEVTSIVQGLPENSNVLVVVDYEPALAGEMEAVSGPLLDQLALLRHPNLSFVATSPNGLALVERLMSNTNINRAAPDGLGYSEGQNYFNLGYLAGAESGVLAFIQSPRAAMPSATVDLFSQYSTVIVLTDNAASARIWIEQLQLAKQRDSSLGLQSLLVASSAQAGPMLQPYVSSRQVNGLITGLVDASRYEFMNNNRPGVARSYWDAFGVGLMMAVGLIVLGSLWSIFAGIRARRAEVAEG